MKLYHVSKKEIRVPDIYFGRKNADFGQGFYLSPDQEFSYRWAADDSVMNVYELDTADLEICRFARSPEWFDYIYQNRRAHDTLAADVVIGPIANDTIFDTLGIISSGLLKPSDALGVLKIGPEYIQVAIKSEKAAARLHWIRSEKIEDAAHYRELVKKEQDDYQQAFAEYMQKLGDQKS